MQCICEILRHLKLLEAKGKEQARVKEVIHISIICFMASQADTNNNHVLLPESLAHILSPQAGKEGPAAQHGKSTRLRMTCLRAGCYWHYRLTGKLVRRQFIFLKLEPFPTQKKKMVTGQFFQTAIKVLPSLCFLGLTGQSLS